jgi:thiamine biosynthesis lipoprotein
MGLERVEVLPVTTQACRVEPRAFKVGISRPAMSTLVSVTALHSSRDTIEEATGRAFEEMDRLIGSLSRFEPASAVSVLNQQGRLRDVPPELGRIVSSALEYHRLSRGSFDVTVQPLVDLLRTSVAGGQTSKPGSDRILDALESVGSHHLKVSSQSIHFERDGMGVTLDGIAKGYIVDRIADVLVQHGIERYLVNAGGDIRCAGTKQGGQPWTVAVQDPAKRGDFPARLRISAGALATSGGYERFFDRPGASHHIVDISTGRSPDRSSSVTVLASTAMAADALATAVFVMGPRDGVALINGLPRCECLIIEMDGRQRVSSGWRNAAQPTLKGRTHDE